MHGSLSKPCRPFRLRTIFDPWAGGWSPALIFFDPCRHRWLAGVAIVLMLAATFRIALGQDKPAARAATKMAPGLKATFRSLDGGAAAKPDFVVHSNVWLYVPAGQSATTFLPTGKFAVEWTGFVALDLRSEYAFQAHVNGDVKVEINGTSVLDANFTGPAIGRGKLIRLNKGPNALKVSYRSPPTGDAFVRLEWTPKGGLPVPIPSGSLTHEPDGELKVANELRLGQELIAEYRCLKCHRPPASSSVRPDLAMDAPDFSGLGSRRNFDWLAQWILDPRAQRSTARMPRLFHGPNARSDAQAAAAFLGSLKGEAPVPREVIAEHKEAGHKLFESLHCAACHQAPTETESDSSRISLKHVSEKFAAGALTAFLKKPEAHFGWTRMPNFKLSDDEARQLAAYLEANASPAKVSASRTGAELIEAGRKLIQTAGCLNCHNLKLDNQFAGKSLADLPARRWTEGCLAEAPAEGSRAPRFGFSAVQRDALRAFGVTDRSSLDRFVPAEFAQWQIRDLNCSECHGKVEGFPALEILGGKLKPEWTKTFIAGEVAFKPRPWLEARMPAFPARAEGLAGGLAMGHGYPPRTPAEPPVDHVAAAVGQKLVSAAGGFSCIACHAVGESGATQVFDSPGINLNYAGERLLKAYFQRWLRNPLAVEPSTKMPVYFDEEGRSPLADIFDGDGDKQILAIWEYLRLGKKMPPPPAP